MKKKILITFLLSIIATFMMVSAFAVEDIMLISEPIIWAPAPNIEYMPKDDTIKLQMDGKYVDFTDEKGNVVNPVIINDRTMIPVAKIFSLLECPYEWIGAERKVVATALDKEITLTIDSEILKIKDLKTNEEKEIILDSVPVIRNDRTLVPVRVITECLDKVVGWDNANRTVIIIDFNKITEEFKEKVPSLQKIFDLEIEPLQSFKSVSDLEGKITYKDKENRKNNETIDIEGSLELSLNKENVLEMYLDLEFDGKGTIYDSMKEADSDKIETGIIMTDESAYVMTKENGKKVWTNIGASADTSSISSMNLSSTLNSYEEYVEFIKGNIGELNVSSYETIQQMIELLANMYDEENFSISGSGKVKTIKYDLDVMDIMSDIYANDVEEIGNLKMKISSIEKVSDKKVDSAKVTFELSLDEPSSKESLGIEIELDMKYKNINQDFKIELPKV